MALAQLLAQLCWHFRETNMAIKNVLQIGRSRESHYIIKSESASNEHAMLIVSDTGRYLLIDCDSTNGTRVLSDTSAKKIKQTEVYLDNLVMFGDHECSVRNIDIVKNSAASRERSSDYTQIRDPIDGSIRRTPR